MGTYSISVCHFTYNTPHTKIVNDETKYFEIELTFINGDTATYEMTYDKFQKFLNKFYNDINFVIDDQLNTRYSDDIK